MNSIFPTSTINHIVREQMELTSIEYMVGDYYQWRSIRGEWFEEGVADTAEVLGLSASLVSSARSSLLDKGYVKKNGRKYAITPQWTYNIMLIQGGHKVQPKSKELAVFFLKRLKEMAKEHGVSINPPSHTNKATIKACANRINTILRSEIIDNDIIEMIIYHKLNTWGHTDQKQYIRYSTLFRSVDKFREYRDNAIQFIKTEQLKRNDH